ncbi:MAG: L7Ae/L30e/S12e/Gadd45 family ribosomal protein [Christensenellales bacterium]
MRTEKIRSYLGFSIKSGKILFGSDKLFESTKRPNLVLICSTQNEKVTKKVLNYCNTNKIKSIKLNNLILSDLIGRENCKVIGILDYNLANAIIKEFEMEN